LLKLLQLLNKSREASCTVGPLHCFGCHGLMLLELLLLCCCCSGQEQSSSSKHRKNTLETER
jgi:hypothetical protein